jgi:hypothetical protein
MRSTTTLTRREHNMADATATDETIIDVTEVEETPRPAPLAHHEPQPAQGGALALFGTTDPVEVVEKASAVAAALMAPVERNGLYLEKEGGRGGKYLQVEAWTLLGSMLQVRAIPQPTQKEPDHQGNWHPPITHTETQRSHSKWCKQGPRNRKGETDHPQQDGCDVYEKEITVVDEPGAGGFTCRVEAIDAAGNVIGASSSRCMWEEARWRTADAYALESMAQTRGISKALSGPLRFIVELAGFKGTPAEEIPDDEWGRGAPAGDSDPARPNGRSGPGKARSDHECPTCGHNVWDNREDNERERAAGQEVKRPAFRCDNPECKGGKGDRPWATWDPHHYTDPTTRAKQLVHKATKANEDGWARQYQPDDPSWSDRERALVAAAAEGTTAERAGWLWSRLRIHTDTIGWHQGDDEQPDDRQVRAIGRAATILLAADEPLSELDAIDQAWAQVTDQELADQRDDAAAAGNPYP